MNYHQEIAQNFKKRYEKVLLKYPDRIIAGCNDEELNQIESKYNIKLPESYKILIKEFGKSSSSLLGSLFMEYPYPLTQTEDFFLPMMEIDEKSGDTPPLEVPEKVFVFANYYGQSIYFFIADGKSEDPPIFWADSSQGDGKIFEYKKVGDSVWEFLEDILHNLEK